MNATKPWWRSKTLWFNAAIASLGALEAGANLIQPYVPGNVYGWGLMVLTVGNAALRVISNQRVSIGSTFSQVGSAGPSGK